MDNFERPPSLRTPDTAGGESGAPERPLGGGVPINELAELVADLIEATGLLTPDKLALVRGRAGQSGSIAQAILEEEQAAIEEEEDELDDLEADDGISDAPLVRLVNSVIFQAAEDGASDVHFEPQEDALVVRFRIDGVLQEVQRIPKRMMAGVTTRLKVLAKLDIAERRKPQDGRISLNAAAAGRMLDVRVATLPTVEGESLG